MRFLPLLAQLHRWAGLAIGSVLILLGVTGAALVFRPELTGLLYPEQARRPPLAEGMWADRVAAIHHRYGDTLRNIKTPRPHLDAWELWLTGEGRAILDGRTLEVLDEWQGVGHPLEFLFKLHADLLAGDAGHLVAGSIGIAGTVMLVTGAVLWWPRRRSFRAGLLKPKANRRGPWLSAHWTAGILLLPLGLVPLATGAAVVFHAQAKALLIAVTFEKPRLPPPSKATGAAGPVDWATALATAREAFPEADMVFISPPRGPSGPVSFRLRQPGEWHPNGRSTVQAEPTTGALLQAVDANALSQGERLSNAIYPIHAARIGGLVFALVTAATGIGLAWISATGIWAWLRGRRASLAEAAHGLIQQQRRRKARQVRQ